MFNSTFTLILLSLFLGTGVWLVFVWAVRKGEFDDIEGPKHRMLDDDGEHFCTGKEKHNGRERDHGGDK